MTLVVGNVRMMGKAGIRLVFIGSRTTVPLPLYNDMNIIQYRVLCWREDLNRNAARDEEMEERCRLYIRPTTVRQQKPQEMATAASILVGMKEPCQGLRTNNERFTTVRCESESLISRNILC